QHTGKAAKAGEAARKITGVLQKIAGSGVKSGLSLTLTQIGLKMDEQLCEQNLRIILHTAQTLGLFIRIDMEDSGCVDSTLRLYRIMHKEGYENFGLVIQAYLYRSQS